MKNPRPGFQEGLLLEWIFSLSLFVELECSRATKQSKSGSFCAGQRDIEMGPERGTQKWVQFPHPFEEETPNPSRNATANAVAKAGRKRHPEAIH